MEIVKAKEGYIVDKSDVKDAVNSALLWQLQANEVTEKSSKEEIEEAFIDLGIAQGIINALKKLCLISKQEYESLSNQQKAIREYLNMLDKKVV